MMGGRVGDPRGRGLCGDEGGRGGREFGNGSEEANRHVR